MSYNGYANYETWVASLWLDNEPDSSEYLYETANNPHISLFGKAHIMENYISELLLSEDMSAGLGADLLKHAIDSIHWDEIIKSHIED